MRDALHCSWLFSARSSASSSSSVESSICGVCVFVRMCVRALACCQRLRRWLRAGACADQCAPARAYVFLYVHGQEHEHDHGIIMIMSMSMKMSMSICERLRIKYYGFYPVRKEKERGYPDGVDRQRLVPHVRALPGNRPSCQTVSEATATF